MFVAAELLRNRLEQRPSSQGDVDTNRLGESIARAGFLFDCCAASCGCCWPTFQMVQSV